MLAHPFLYKASLWQVGVDLYGKFKACFWIQASPEVDKRLPYFLLLGNATSSNRNNDHQRESSLPKILLQLNRKKTYLL